jgi:hypothetical protein
LEGVLLVIGARSLLDMLVEGSVEVEVEDKAVATLLML